MSLPALVIVVLLSVVLTLWMFRRRRPIAPASLRATTTLVIADDPDQPIGFGRKNHWIAARAPDAQSLASALGLIDVRSSNWRSGFVAAYAYPSDYVFVTPPLRGWVLAVGQGLPDPSDPATLQQWRAMMTRVSSRFGEAQFFATHRGASYVAWARYIAGEEKRLFAHADDPIHDVGEPSVEEAEMMAPGEEHVFRLAALWSCDPSALEDANLPASVGLVGRVEGITG